MFAQPKSCPNAGCINHISPPKNWFKKNGSYKVKDKATSLTRYQCKTCLKSFSNSAQKPTFKQHKPEVNAELFKLLVSGVSLRRASVILDISYATVVAKFEYLATQAKSIHTKHLKTVQTAFVQVDELETFIHSKAMCLSVPMAVRVKTGEILGFSVAKMPSKGPLAQIGTQKYNWTIDERPLKFQSMLIDIKPSLKGGVVFKCDSHTSYEKWIKNQIPTANLERVLGGKKAKADEKAFDQLFAINNTFARMRHDMNRLARKTWSTTKSIQGLENHIWLYVAWTNKYKLK